MRGNKITNSYEIIQFPKPFEIEKTPYTQIDFSEDVKKNCNSIINDPRLSKVILLGDVNVGKTSVVNRFCRQSFNFNYKATIGVEFEIQHFKILKTPFNIQM